MLNELNQRPVEDVLWSLEREIVQRTLGRVRRLELRNQGKRIIIHGFTASYFIKQLAIQAALDVVGDAIGKELDLDVQLVVLDSAPAAWPGAGLSAPVA